ncbi:MAG TPA: ATP-binding protein [Polyangiaceae bacterium]|nr:ATP-binding protein [Polyangiaceae bacterium]
MTTSQTPTLVDLANCDREPIHVPGAIQPHGVLIALSEPSLAVALVSENIGDHLGLRVDEVRNQPLSAVLDAASVEQVRSALVDDRWQEMNPLRLLAHGRRADGIVHRHRGIAILELEFFAPSAETGARHPLRSGLRGIQAARTREELCQTVVDEVRQLTGFERVMLYRFDEEGHGCVDAEAKLPALEPYLGLHYPASDIPQQARQLYLKNWLRIIPDGRYRPVRLVPDRWPNTGEPLDLSFSVLRSVSPIHLEYMANMGVRASMSISLVVRDALWGLISCINHSEPRLVPFEVRSLCEVIGRLTSLQLAALEDREAALWRASSRATQQALTEAMRTGDRVLEALLTRPSELMELVGAEGAAVVTAGEEPRTCGHTPPPALVSAIASWLEQHQDLAPFCTSSLPALFPAVAASTEVASGLLSFGLPGAPRRQLLWFRPEILRDVSWGGDPHKPAALGPEQRIHPRRSFELWKEQVRERSRPWTAGDLEAADDLRRSAVELDLERQVAREQEAVRARDDLVAVVSHDLRTPLGVIQMQAAMFLRSSGAEGEDVSPRVRAGAERIQRAVNRMNSLVHDLLDLAKIEAGRFTLQRQSEEIGELVEEALIILRPLAESKRINLEIALTDRCRVNVDRERIFQVFSNLVGNAIKFTPEGGRIALRAEAGNGSMRVTITDTGPGVPPDQIPHVFNRYWQARRTEREGTGLGLYIAKGIVEAHDGRIWVEPTGPGATFRFTLPLA